LPPGNEALDFVSIGLWRYKMTALFFVFLDGSSKFRRFL